MLVGKIKDRVWTDAELVITDEYKAYQSVAKDYGHEVINHIREWVRRNIHTNTIENFWSLFRRGVIGSFHKVSANHLPRYLAEFAYRFNRREEESIFMMTVSRLLGTIAPPYMNLVAEK